MSDNESDYEYVGGAVAIQPDPENPMVQVFHLKCRPKHGGPYVIVSHDPGVAFDAGGKPIGHDCPECGQEILTARRTS